MIALRITDIKAFMNHLFIKDYFDDFLLINIEVGGFASFKIDGKRLKAWYDEAFDGGEYILWKEAKTRVFSFVKGDKPPLFIKAVFRADSKRKAQVMPMKVLKEPSEMEVFFNLKYDETGLVLTTGSFVTDFLIGKEVDSLWDTEFSNILKNCQISYETE